jgi:hypothetical protein
MKFKLTYYLRLGDSNPIMNLEKCNKFLNILLKYNIKPIIGIIPHNYDLTFLSNTFNNNFLIY